MDSVKRKIQAAEQTENMNKMFLAGNTRKHQTVWEKAEQKEQDSPELPLNQKESIDRNIRPEILDVMTVSEAKSSLKLLDW